MICPNCKKSIDEVNVYSQYVQTGYLNGNHITDYVSGEVLDLINIECSLCGADITKLIKEND